MIRVDPNRRFLFRKKKAFLVPLQKNCGLTADLQYLVFFKNLNRLYLLPDF